MKFFSNLNLIGMVFLSGVFSAGFYFILYDDGGELKSQISSVQQQIVQSDSKVKQKKQELKEAVAFDYSVKRLGREIDIFISYLPTQLTTRNMYEDITNVSKESQVNIQSMTSSQQKVRGSSLYDAISVNLTLEGEYSQLLTFLSKLTALEKFITVKQINVRPVRKNDKKVVRVQKIKADMVLLGYRYLGSSSSSDNKKSNI